MSPAEATFCESVESGHSSHDDAAVIAEKLGVTNPPYRIDSQCKYAAVARGDASIYLRLPTRADYEEKIWDHAAGWMVINEAGGRVTDVRGEPLDFSIGRTLKNNKGVVATNGKLHDQVIAVVREVLGM
jgi:3'(2'), 5'-bisphosphate nucleotidase